jgi:hypothetical protein
VLKPLGRQLGISFPVSDTNHSQPLKTDKRANLDAH